MTDPLPEPAPPPAPRHVSRGRAIAARILVIVGILLTVISILSSYVKREALDKDHFRNTSEALIANDKIRDQVALAMVDALYNNVDVSAELEKQLPKNLQRLSGPIAGAARDLADRAAREVLDRPATQKLFVAAAAAAQRQLVAVLEGDTRVVDTTGGNVVLDIRPLVLRLGDRFQFVSNLADRVPQDSAQVTVLQSDDLATAQDVTQWLKAIANWIWILAVGCGALAIWLVPGRRRREVRAIGIGLVVVGVLLLVIRSLAGNYIVDNVVVTESVKPAVNEAWDIITDGLASSAWVSIWVGVLAAIGAWITGQGKRPVTARRWLAPHMRRPEVAWGGFAFLLVLILWRLPVQEARTDLVLAAVAIIGFEVFRRQVAREEPAVTGQGDVLGGLKDRVAGMRGASAKPSRTDELERLATLHTAGALTDEEFAAAKADVLS